MRKTPVGERIAAKCVPGPNGCIEYTGGAANSRSGHRLVWTDDGMRLVHRVAWTIANGPIPDGLKVCHQCDNPPCVNVDHLFLGTAADNNRDRDEKGRHVSLRGERNGFAKLTAEQVREIVAALEARESQSSIARRFGTHKGTISGIARGATWTEVTGYTPDNPAPKAKTGAPFGLRNGRAKKKAA